MRQILVLLVLVLGITVNATAESFTGSGAFSDPANWSGHTVPGNGNAVTIDGASGPLTIDIAVQVASLTVDAAYSKTITQSATLTTTGDWTLNGGTWITGAQTLIVGGAFSVAASGADFQAGTGNVVLSGTSTLSNPSCPFSLLTISAGQTTTLISDTIVTQLCTVSGELAFNDWHVLHLRGSGNLLAVPGSLNAIYPHRGVVSFEAVSSDPVLVPGGSYGWTQLSLTSLGGAAADFEQSGSISAIDSFLTTADTASGSVLWNTNSFNLTSSSWLSLGDFGTSAGGTTLHAGASQIVAPALCWVTTPNDAVYLESSTITAGEWAIWDASVHVDPGTSTLIVANGIGPFWTTIPHAFYNLQVTGSCPLYGPITVAHDISVLAGGALSTGNQAVTIGHDCSVLSGGSLAAGSSAISVGSDLAIAGEDGAFQAGTSSVTVSGPGTVSDPDQSNAFYQLSLAGPGARVLLATDITTTNHGTVIAGEVDFHNGPGATWHLQGTGEVFTNQGSLWAGFGNGGYVRYENASSTIPMTVAGTSYGWASLQLVSRGGATASFEQAGDITAIDDMLTMVDTAGGSVHWVTNSHQIDSSSWMAIGNWGSALGGTTMDCGTSAISVPAIAWFSHPDDVINLQGSTWTVGLWGAWNESAVINPGTSTVIANNDLGVFWTTIPQVFNNLVISAPGGAATAFGEVTVTGSLTVAAGSLLANGNAIVADGAVTVAPGATLDGQLVELAAAGDQTMISSDTTVMSELQIDGGVRTLSLPSGMVAGSLQVAPGPTLVVGAGATVTAGGVSLAGTPTLPITVHSSKPGAPWFLTLSPSGTQSLSYVSAQDSNAGFGQVINDTDHGVDLGGNINWDFGVVTAPPPVFTLASSQITLTENSPSQSISAFATITSPLNVAISYVLTTNNGSLFSAQPAITPDGTLTFTPASNQIGSAAVNVIAYSAGNPTASAAHAFTISLLPSPPIFTVSPAVITLNANAPPQSDPGFAVVSSPLNVAVAFQVHADNPALFTSQPAIDGSGTLTFAPAANLSGSTVVTVTGTSAGNPAVSAPHTFTITLSPTSDGTTPPTPPTVALSIVGGLTGDQSATANGTTYYFTNSPPVTLSVSVTGTTGVVSSITVSSSDGAVIDCTTGTGSYTPAIDGPAQLVASATVTLNGFTASGVSTPITLISAVTPPTITWYQGPQYAASGQSAMPLRNSLTSDANLVLLNSMSESNNNAALRSQGLNVFDRAGFTAVAVLSGPAGFSQASTASSATAGSTTLTLSAMPDGNPFTQSMAVSGFSGLADSIAFDTKAITISSVTGAYTLHANLQDQCGNIINADQFKIWVKTALPIAMLGIIPHQFINKPIFQVAPNGKSELIPARTVVAEADAMAIWQDSVSEANRMIKLAATPEGVPSSGQGSGVLSGWWLKHPIKPSGIPTNAGLSATSGSWVQDEAQVIVQDSCGNISSAITIPATITIFPANSGTTTDGCKAKSAPVAVTMMEQPFIGDQWLYSSTSNGQPVTVVDTAVDGLNMPNQINDGAISRTSAISDADVRFGNEAMLAPGTMGPGVISVPPSWQTGPTVITLGITHPGISAPLSQSSPQAFGVSYKNSSPPPPNGFPVFTFPPNVRLNPPPPTSSLTWDDGGDAELSELLGTFNFPGTSNVIDSGTMVMATIALAPPTWSDPLHLEDGSTKPIQATPLALAIATPASQTVAACGQATQDNPASSATQDNAGFQVSIDRSLVTPGFQRVGYWRVGKDTTPLNTSDLCFQGATVKGTASGAIAESTQSVVPTGDPNVCNLQATVNLTWFTGQQQVSYTPSIHLSRDLATTSTYQHQTGFRWANLVKIDNDVITTGQTTLTLHGGFVGNDINGAPFNADSLIGSTAPETLVIRDPDVENATLALAGWSGWQTAVTTVNQQMDAQDTSLSQPSKDIAATTAMTTALNAVSTILSQMQQVITDAQNAVSNAQSQLTTDQAALGSSGSSVTQQTITDDRQTLTEAQAYQTEAAAAPAAITSIRQTLQNNQTTMNQVMGPLDGMLLGVARKQIPFATSGNVLPRANILPYMQQITKLVFTVAADYSRTSLLSIVGADPTTYSSNRIYITKQAIIYPEVNASLTPALILNLVVGQNVPAKVYHIDITCGPVHAYSDELSQLTAGANGSHRMKQALSITSLRFVDLQNRPAKNLPDLDPGFLAEYATRQEHSPSSSGAFLPTFAIQLQGLSQTQVDTLALVTAGNPDQIFTETGINTKVFSSTNGTITINRASSLAPSTIDDIYVTMNVTSPTIQGQGDLEETDFSTLLFSIPAVPAFPSAQPNGIAQGITGPVIDGQLESVGLLPVLSQIPDSYKTRLRYQGQPDQGPSIDVQLNGGDGPQSVHLTKQGDGSYLSDKVIIVYFGSLSQALRSGLESDLNAIFVHNPTIKAEFGQIVTIAGTYQVYVDVDHKKPNFLHADGAAVTVVVFQDTAKKSGIKVKFTADHGTIENDVKTTDANGIASATYTADTKSSTATVTAEVVDENLSLETFIYNEKFDFTNLTNNQGMGGYTDASFVNNNDMSEVQVQEFLAGHNSFLATYSEGGVSAAKIIKDAADAVVINPKIILVTLEKEQGLISQQKAVAADSSKLTEAMGVASTIAANFTDQVKIGAHSLKNRFNEAPAYFQIVSKLKVDSNGHRVDNYFTANHLYLVPSTGDRNVHVAVGFTALNKATFAQHRYTNWLTHRRDIEVSLFPDPLVGGVYRFAQLWSLYFGG